MAWEMYFLVFYYHTSEPAKRGKRETKKERKKEGVELRREKKKERKKLWRNKFQETRTRQDRQELFFPAKREQVRKKILFMENILSA